MEDCCRLCNDQLCSTCDKLTCDFCHLQSCALCTRSVKYSLQICSQCYQGESKNKQRELGLLFWPTRGSSYVHHACTDALLDGLLDYFEREKSNWIEKYKEVKEKYGSGSYLFDLLDRKDAFASMDYCYSQEIRNSLPALSGDQFVIAVRIRDPFSKKVLAKRRILCM